MTNRLSFKDFIVEVAANYTEKEEIQKDSRLLIGAEIEYIRESSLSEEQDHLDHLFGRGSFDLVEDTSIQAYSYPEHGFEIITKPHTWAAFERDMKAFLGYVQKYGRTNDSCGFHVTFSYGGTPLPNRFGDRLVNALEEQKVYNDFPSREKNTFTRSRQRPRYAKANYYDKYFTFRIRKEQANLVEFRILGGKDYEKKWPIMRNILLDYAVKYKKALLDDDFMKRQINTPNRHLYSFEKYMKDFGFDQVPNPNTLVTYAIQVIDQRWEVAEKYIINSPIASAKYAAHVLKERWPEAEPNIVKSTDALDLYVHYVIAPSGKRWEFGEYWICDDGENVLRTYLSKIIAPTRQRWEALEYTILKEFSQSYGQPSINKVIAYMKWVLIPNKLRWPEIEKAVLNMYSHSVVDEYKRTVLGLR